MACHGYFNSEVDNADVKTTVKVTGPSARFFICVHCLVTFFFLRLKCHTLVENDVHVRQNVYTFS